MNRVVLTEAEALWIAQNVVRSINTMEAAAKKDPEILSRTTYKTLVKIREANQKKTLEMYFTPKQKTVLRQSIDGVVKALQEQIIPVYERKGPEYQEYKTDALTKVDMLKKLARKLR